MKDEVGLYRMGRKGEEVLLCHRRRSSRIGTGARARVIREEPTTKGGEKEKKKEKI